MTKPASLAPRPFLKWAGGKRQIIDEIIGRVPRDFRTYYEPFVGGGAVFFELASEEPRRFVKARLNDKNHELIDVYRALRDDLPKVIEVLSRYKHSERSYYRARSSKPRTLPERAARTIYLNRTCFNGLYRVNGKGQFNVPFGRYKNPTICDHVCLTLAAVALQGVELTSIDFESACSNVQSTDFVYFDPPYLPTSKTSDFTAYNAGGFGLDDHKKLATYFHILKRSVGAEVLLSNSDRPEIRELYRGDEIDEVLAARAINSRGSGRGKITELLIR